MAVSKYMVKAFFSKSELGESTRGSVKRIWQEHRPLYVIRRQCVSGDVEYRAVVRAEFADVMEALRALGADVTIHEIGEA